MEKWYKETNKIGDTTVFANGFKFCLPYQGDTTTETADLICAAPQMLEALRHTKRLLDAIPEKGIAHTMLDQSVNHAIRLAESGES